MFQRILHFIKYNNAVVLIILAIFLLSTGVFAQTETGQAIIGQKQTRINGTDNKLLLAVDLGAFNMDFKIEKIEQDDNYYYVTYTFVDLTEEDNAWQYLMKEKVRKVSRKFKKDIGLYLAEELQEEYQARLKELTKEQAKAKTKGEQKRIAVTEFSGLIGKSLNLTGKVFTNYQPVKKVELASPVSLPALRNMAHYNAGAEQQEQQSINDNLTQVYQDYVSQHDPDQDNIFSESDNCPEINNPDQLDSDNDGIGDVCDSDNTSLPEALETGGTATTSATTTPETINPAEGEVEIIELPSAPEATTTPSTPEIQPETGQSATTT